MFRYRLSSFALFLAIVCIGLGWYVDRNRLAEELDATKDPTMLRVSILAEKYLYWSPSHYIRNDYLQLESVLSHRVGEFTGIIRESSQGFNHGNLRVPSIETLDAVIDLLDDDDHAIQLAATQLTAIYLESVSGRNVADEQSIRLKAHFQSKGLPVMLDLLNSPDPRVGAAAALSIGNTFPTNNSKQLLIKALERNAEKDNGNRLEIAWAIRMITG